MEIIVYFILIALSLLGRMIIIWHKVAGDGFGLGPFNRPKLLRNSNIASIVWLIGMILWLGALFLIWKTTTWYWTFIAIFITFSVDKVLFAQIFKSDIEYCANILKKMENELKTSDIKNSQKNVEPNIAEIYNLQTDAPPDIQGGNKRKLTILLSFRLSPEYSELFKDLGYNVVWATDPDSLQKLAQVNDIDLALEWQHGETDFSVRDMLRQIGKKVPIIMCRNWRQGIWNDDRELKIHGYAAAVDVPFKVDEFMELCKQLTTR